MHTKTHNKVFPDTGFDSPNKMLHTILFGPPKQGGILQSSGFLDLKDLMTLKRTAKAHAFDEQSLIQLIENEVTRDHNCHTVEEAIAFCKTTWRQPWFKGWLYRSTSSVATPGQLVCALENDVMFRRMFNSIPEAQIFHILMEKDVLHGVADSGRSEYIHLIFSKLSKEEGVNALLMKRTRDGATIVHSSIHHFRVLEACLAHCPKALCFEVLSKKDNNGWTLLHLAAQRRRFDSMKLIWAIVNEKERGQLVFARDAFGQTALHHAAIPGGIYGSSEDIDTVLSFLASNADRTSLVRLQDNKGRTALHDTALFGCSETINSLCRVCSGADLFQLLQIQDENGRTALHDAVFRGIPDKVETIINLCDEANRTQIMLMQDRYGNTVLHEAALHGYADCIDIILRLCEETDHARLMHMRNGKGRIALHLVANTNPDTIIRLFSVSDQETMHMQDNDGKTVLDQARHSHLRKIILSLMFPGTKDTSHDSQDQNIID